MTKHYDFIEIGTSDFDTIIETSDDKTVGLSIEPIRYYLDRLPNKENVKKIEAAISDNDGFIEIYYIPDEKIQEHNLKWWVRGSNSIGKPHPFALQELGEEFYNSIVKIEKVPTLSWKTLVEKEEIGSIDYLKIDTEGFDHIILNDYLKMCEENPNLLARKIKFERHSNVSNISEIDIIISKFKGYKVEYSESDVVLQKLRVPKIIHQTFRTKELPEELRVSVESLKKLNPDFEYRFYDDEDCYNFIKENYDEETLLLYSSINPNYGSSKADFFRYLLMYKVGGVYLDIKSSARIPFNDIILPTDEYLLTHWEGRDWNQILNYYHGEFQNWHIICKPNHPFLEKTIELVKRNIRNYRGEKGKLSVLNLTGPIVYSKAIVSLIDEHRTYTFNSPVREFKLEDEIHLTYKNILPHHSSIYGTNVAQNEPIIIKEINTTNKSYLLYSTESYFDIVNACVKSIREFSELPIIVYLINSDKQIEVSNTKTIRWDLEIDDLSENLYVKNNDNFYIDRKKSSIYNILIQRPLIVKDALEKYSNVIAYVDSDSVATQYCDRIFDMYDSNLDYPYFVEGIYDYLHINGRGGAESRDDLSTTLEHPACELFGVNQYVRQRYRQTGYFVAGQNTIDFMDEWYQMCIHPKILEDFQHYAPYHEETIANVLLWKYNRLDGLPYIYVNGDNQTLDRIFNNNEFTGESRHLGHWLRIPATEQDLLFVHGEKRGWIITEMLERLKIRLSINKKNCGDTLKKMKVLFLAPHLSTGGMPGFLLKRIQALKEHYKDVDLFVAEHGFYSSEYVVQRNKIIDLVGKDKFWSLGNDKMKLIDVIKENNIDIVHVDEMIEGFDSYNKVPNQLMNALYDNNRTWRMVETCHNVSFNPTHSKKFHPDAYAFCTPYHKEVTFKDVPSYGEVIEFPIDKRFRTKEEQESAQKELGLSLDRTHIINVGLWTSGKNQVEGVEIARLLEKSHPGLQFHFIGNQAPNFKEYWEPVMNNLPSNVKVWGERSDVSTFMKAADVFMFNSTWECNPLVLREAASYGLKILARNLPQYLGMFDTFVTPLTDNLEQNVNILLELINSDKSYNIELGASKKFALEHYNLYKLTMTKEPMENTKSISDVNIIQYYINQPFLEIRGENDSTYKVKFFDEQGVCHYENDLKSNHWVRLNREYFTKWNTKIWEDETLIYDNTLDYKGKRVFINFDSKSLGDSLSWIPYALEFQNVHQCKVIVCTYWNNLFSKVYPELEFVVPGSTVNNIHGQYSIGWFYDQNKEPQLPNTIPLQKCVTNILGLPFEEIKPRISYQIGKRPYKQKYVTIATNSTSGCKFWTREGWQELINHLHSLGYKIINVSLENNPFKNCEKIKNTDINYTMNVIHHSEFFIGLSSGLSWLAWSLDKHVVMISNFTEPDHEFTSNCTRIINKSVCNGCWNNPNYKFDRGDWNYCPVHKGTERQFECHTSITSEMVINQIQHLLK
jgi:autotransporter strand-loop-strand O-heptosyltransferase